MKYHEIVDHLRERIDAGRFRPGDRVPSENQLARRFDVSRPTAARALRELEQEGILERRAGSGTYVRDAARAGGTGHTFGLLVPGLGSTEVLDPICTEIARAGQDVGANVLWGGSIDTSDPVTEVDELCARYVESGVDGVFLAPHETIPDRARQNARTVAVLREAGIAVVLLDRESAEFPARSGLDLVAMDDLQAGIDLTGHLVEVGHRRIAFLARPAHPSTTDRRAAGCELLLRHHGLEVDEHWRWSGDPEDDGFVGELLATARPDVVVCSNDLTAALLIATLSRLRVQVPDDVAVAGFDDVRYSTLLSVPLTTVHMPCRDIGREAIRTMLDRLERPTAPPRQILLPGHVVVRRSCGATGSNAD